MTVVAIRRQDGNVLCERCTVAETTLRRMRGLLGHRSLGPNEGLLLRPAPAIQTWFLRFPIDAVLLDRDLGVIAVREHMRPFRTASHHRARSVLELAAGEVERHGIAVGERLRIVWPGEQVVRGPGELAHGERRVRVAVATPDARFLRVATFLLERHGYGVEPHRSAADLLDVVGRQRTDVAVIDATESLTSAARVTRAIEGLDPTVGVVVVAERNGADAPENLRVMEKWASFDSIIEQIEAASRRTAAA